LNTYYDLLVFELFDDEYYRNLEMWVRDYSRLLEMIPFESIGTVSYLTTNYGRIFNHFGDHQRKA